MMGYQQNGEFEEDDVEALESVVAQALIANGQEPDAQQLRMMQDQQQIILQQKQFQEAMRIQMAMKQMPLDDGMNPTESMGLRVKKSGLQQRELQEEFELAPPVVIGSEDQPFEDQLTEQEKFALDKKLFAQQMKEQLLGRKAAAQDQEEIKAGGVVLDQNALTESSEEDDNRVGLDDEKSFDS